jgi:hypothetical protein
MFSSFINEKGKNIEITINPSYLGDCIEMTIKSSDSESSWEITKLEFIELKKLLDTFEV